MADAAAEEPVKPKPPGRHKTVRELRQEVKANEKYFCSTKPVEEGVKLIAEKYMTTDACALAFVEWIQGKPGSGDDAPREPQVSSLERLRRGFDPATGTEVWLDPNEPPPAKKKK
jgi:hypothetical protein